MTLLLQAKVEYVLLHFASRAMYGQLLQAGVVIQEYHRSMLHAKVAVVDDRWATVGSSNIDPYSLLMAREANVIVRDRGFAERAQRELVEMIENGARRVAVTGLAGPVEPVQGGDLDRLRHRAPRDGLPRLRRRRMVPAARARVSRLLD